MSSPSRYATRAEALSNPFMARNRRLDELNVEYGLPDHTVVNRFRYPWADVLHAPEFYASRLWEYPWALFEAQLEPGMRCADVGCGQSPLTLFLQHDARCEVVGFDPEMGDAYTGHLCHGIPPAFSRRTAIEFVASPAEQPDAEDDYFDRVFCISVIEHIPTRAARA